ncbi:neural cell adhesion molecule 1 isoform X1 [Amia ocellicauda]|uniref:neural cell adhesion molecule 1 isoform X1 n=2 Tax=Amia ocellicauda TaxID=2972642 RepID=UPI003464C9DD
MLQRISVWALLVACASAASKKIEIITSNVNMELGSNAQLLCRASGGEAEITWMKDDVELEADSDDHYIVKKHDEKSSELIIMGATIEDSGVYRCSGQYEDGDFKQASVDISIIQKVNFKNIQKYQTFTSGQVATISCEVAGIPQPTMTWRFHGKEVSRDTDERVTILPGQGLRIVNVSRSDHGPWECVGKIKERNEENVLQISVVINAPIKIHLRETEKNVTVGPTNVSLSCPVSGYPAPEINWTGPQGSDFSRYQYNSDRSELTILWVGKSDEGNFTCTATNTISKDSATIRLRVSVKPGIQLEEKAKALPGENVTVTCLVTGDPSPTILWSRKSSGEQLTSGGHVQISAGPMSSTLTVREVVPSDGDLYTCTASSPVGQDSKDFNLQTLPGTPEQVKLHVGPSSVLFSLGPMADGGSPVTQYHLQWRSQGESEWNKWVIAASEPLAITSLQPYSTYIVRLSAVNVVGEGGFSAEQEVCTLSKREPDRPHVKSDGGRPEGNSYRIPFKQLDDGGSPITHYAVRYSMESGDESWHNLTLLADSQELLLTGLEFGQKYMVEISAVNPSGASSPASLTFTLPEPSPTQAVSAIHQKSGVGTGAVVGIVMVIFLVLLMAVDATCFYTNKCGMLMCIAVNLLGKKHPGAKELDPEEAEISTVDVKLKGLSAPGRSVPKTQNGVRSEVTCDKAPLTKFENVPQKNEQPSAPSFTEA